MKNKHISIEEFLSNLKSTYSGIKYLDLVMNNQISIDDEGENHHIYMKAICGKNSYIYRLSYYNHILAHYYLVKSGIEGHFWWKGKAFAAIREFSRKQIKQLSDFDKINLTNISDWAELNKLAHKEVGKLIHENYENKTKEEREIIRKNHQIGAINRYKDPNEHIKTSEAVTEGYANMSPKRREEWIENVKNGLANMSSEAKAERNMKCAIGTSNRIANMPPEEREEWIEKNRQAQLNRYKDPNEHIKTGEAVKIGLANMSIEVREGWLQKLSKNQTERFQNMTPEELKEYGKLISIGMNNRTPEQIQQWLFNCHNGHVDTKRMNNGSENILVKYYLVDEYLLNGYNIGWLNTIEHNWVNNGIIETLVSIKNLEEYYLNGWLPGRLKRSEESNKKNSESQSGYWWMTSETDEHVYQVIPRKQQDFIDRGYYRCMGRKNREPYKVIIRSSNRKEASKKGWVTINKNKEGKIYIYKGQSRKWIFEEELPIYIAAGYKQKQLLIHPKAKLMTDGNSKPKKIKFEQVSEYELIGWYLCDRKGNKKVA